MMNESHFSLFVRNASYSEKATIIIKDMLQELGIVTSKKMFYFCELLKDKSALRIPAVA